MMVRTVLLASLVLLASCRGQAGSDAATDPTARASTEPAASASATAVAGPHGAVAVSEKNQLYVFEYAYPETAGRIPELAALLDRRGDAAKQELIDQAEEGKEAAEDSGFPYNAYSFSQEWQVVADVPGYLSLSSEETTYLGGAHGNYATRTLVWDRKSARALRPRDMFTSLDALESVLGDRYCEQLNQQRAKKRGEAVPAETEDPFDACPSFSDLVILLGSRRGKAFDRIGLLADPYLAGPWAEGKYEVTLPVTPAVIEAVRPEYAKAFAAAH